MFEDRSFTTALGANQAHLLVLETTDLHLHLLGYDYFADRPAADLGLARLASLIRRLRAAAANSLLFDNGDFLQGTPLSDTVPPPGGADRPHPAIAAMQVLGYDAAAIGNHEFDFGLAFLERALVGATFPLVCANVVRCLGRDPTEDEPLVPPWVILDRTLAMGDGRARTLRVGIIGVVTPHIPSWDPHGPDRLAVRDIMDAAEAHVPRMKAAGADIVIALSHSGIGADTRVTGMENASVPLAAVPGIDVVLAGHTHGVFPGPATEASAAVDPSAGTLHGKPAVMAGFHGSHLGAIDLVLTRRRGAWQVTAHRSRAIPAGAAADPREDAAIVASVTGAHESALDYIRRPLGRITAPLHSYFALVAPDPSVQLVADAQRAAMAVSGRVSGRVPGRGARAVLSSAAPFRTGGRGGPGNFVDIAPGPLLLRHAAELYTYPNRLCVLDLDGAEIRAWLERSASIFRRITPGLPDQVLLARDHPGYNFDVLDGLGYAIDLTAPAGDRIRDLREGGRPVAAGDRFLVITNSYRAGGGGGFVAAGKPDLGGSRLTARDAVIDLVRRQSPLVPRVVATWRFAPVGNGTSALFDSGPGACAHLAAVRERGIEHAGPGEDGFERFRIHL